MRVWNCFRRIQEILEALCQESAEGNIWIYTEERNGRLRRYKIMGSFAMFICSQLTYSINYLVTSLLTYSRDQSPSWEVNWFPASQETPHIVWNPKVYYPIYKWPPLVPVLSEINPVDAPQFFFQKIHLNISIKLTSGSSKCSLSLRFPHQHPVYTSPLSHKRYMHRPSHSSRFDHPNKSW